MVRTSWAMEIMSFQQTLTVISPVSGSLRYNTSFPAKQSTKLNHSSTEKTTQLLTKRDKNKPTHITSLSVQK